MRTALAALLMVLLAGPAFAVNPGEALADPALEARARSISAELRCLVCQNQSIDQSDADLAHELRAIVRERLAAGDDDAAVKQYVVDRYGEFVLLRPVFALHTLILWLAAPVVLLAGGVAIWFGLRRRRRAPLAVDESALDPDEEQALNALRDMGNRAGLK